MSTVMLSLAKHLVFFVQSAVFPQQELLHDSVNVS